MKPFSILTAKGDTVEKAVSTLNDAIKKTFEEQSCEIAQLIIVPELVQQTIAKPEQPGRATVQITVVALIQAENPIEMLSRSYIQVLEKAAQEYDSVSAYLLNWIETLKAMHPPARV